MSRESTVVQPIQSLANKVRQTVDPNLLLAIAEEDCCSQEQSECQKPVFRSHFACEQG